MQQPLGLARALRDVEQAAPVGEKRQPLGRGRAEGGDLHLRGGRDQVDGVDRLGRVHGIDDGDPIAPRRDREGSPARERGDHAAGDADRGGPAEVVADVDDPAAVGREGEGADAHRSRLIRGQVAGDQRLAGAVEPHGVELVQHRGGRRKARGQQERAVGRDVIAPGSDVAGLRHPHRAAAGPRQVAVDVGDGQRRGVGGRDEEQRAGRGERRPPRTGEVVERIVGAVAIDDVDAGRAGRAAVDRRRAGLVGGPLAVRRHDQGPPPRRRRQRGGLSGLGVDRHQHARPPVTVAVVERVDPGAVGRDHVLAAGAQQVAHEGRVQGQRRQGPPVGAGQEQPSRVPQPFGGRHPRRQRRDVARRKGHPQDLVRRRRRAGDPQQKVAPVRGEQRLPGVAGRERPARDQRRQRPAGELARIGVAAAAVGDRPRVGGAVPRQIGSPVPRRVAVPRDAAIAGRPPGR